MRKMLFKVITGTIKSYVKNVEKSLCKQMLSGKEPQADICEWCNRGKTWPNSKKKQISPKRDCGARIPIGEIRKGGGSR